MTTITVAAEYIGVLKIFAAKNDVRYYLNSIKVEIRKDAVYMVATDGYRLGAFRVQKTKPMVEEIEAIIPLELLEGIKANKGPVEITIGTGPNDTCHSVMIKQNGISVEGWSIDGKYPDWRKVVPKKVSGQTGQFNPRYIGDLAKAAKLLDINEQSKYGEVTIGHNGEEGAALVEFANEAFIGVIMPWRVKQVPKAPPAWAT